MSFITPMLAAAGLIAMAIPIIIHFLFRRRRKPVPWAAMQFLLEALRRHRRRLQLEQIILMAVRCLALGLFGAALAQPLLRDTGVLDLGGSRAVLLVIDNGLTSAVVDENGETALRRHADFAIDVLDELRPGDGVGIITTARPALPLVSPPSADHGKIRTLLQRMEPSQAACDLPLALDRLDQSIVDALERHDQVHVMLLSDFRAGSAALDRPLTTSLTSLNDRVTFEYCAPATRAAENVRITSVAPMRHVVLPGTIDGSGQTTVRLARTGGALGRAITTVRLDTTTPGEVEPQVVQWAEGQTEASAEFLLDFSSAEDRDVGLSVSIDTDALTADDTRHAVLAVRRRVRLVLIDRRDFGAAADVTELSAGQWIRRALEPFQERSPMEFIALEPGVLSPADMRLADAAVLTRPDLLDENGWNVLRTFVSDGGVLIVAPPGELRVHRWIEQMIDTLALPWRIQVETQDDSGAGMRLADEQPSTALLRMVSGELNDLARPVVVQRWLPIDDAATDATAVLQFTDGSPLVIAGSPSEQTDEDGRTLTSRGMVMFIATAPELAWTNLPTKPLIVPLFQELIRQGLSQVRHSGDATVGASRAPALTSSVAELQHVQSASAQVFVGDNGTLEQPVPQSGLYQMLDRASQPLGLLAANVEAHAGRTDVQSAASVEAWLSKSGPWNLRASDAESEEGDVAVADTGSSGGLARWLLLAVLALVAIETMLARWFSHAVIRRGDPVTGDRAPTLGVSS